MYSDDVEIENKVALVNPEDSGRIAHWFWGGKPYQLAPGEAKAMVPFLADHARKHNPWLFVGDMTTNQAEFAKMQERAAQAKVDQARQDLEKSAELLRKAQAQQVQASTNRRAKEEEDRRLAEQEAEAQRIANQAEQEKLEAAKKAAGVKPKH